MTEKILYHTEKIELNIPSGECCTCDICKRLIYSRHIVSSDPGTGLIDQSKKEEVDRKNTKGVFWLQVEKNPFEIYDVCSKECLNELINDFYEEMLVGITSHYDVMVKFIRCYETEANMKEVRND